MNTTTTTSSRSGVSSRLRRDELPRFVVPPHGAAAPVRSVTCTLDVSGRDIRCTPSRKGLSFIALAITHTVEVVNGRVTWFVQVDGRSQRDERGGHTRITLVVTDDNDQDVELIESLPAPPEWFLSAVLALAADSEVPSPAGVI